VRNERTNTGSEKPADYLLQTGTVAQYDDSALAGHSCNYRTVTLTDAPSQDRKRHIWSVTASVCPVPSAHRNSDRLLAGTRDQSVPIKWLTRRIGTVVWAFNGPQQALVHGCLHYAVHNLPVATVSVCLRIAFRLRALSKSRPFASESDDAKASSQPIGLFKGESELLLNIIVTSFRF